MLTADAAVANEGLVQFGHLDAEHASVPGIAPAVKRKTKARTNNGKTAATTISIEPAPAAPWGPMPTDKSSVVNLAPGLLAFFNDGPVFGLPGTVTGDITQRTQILGDWGGTRTELARKGFFFDLYSTSYYQNVTSGGLKTGEAFVQNTQLSVNIDTGRAGWWSGGLIHLTAQSRLGDDPASTFTAGSVVPHYTGLVLPDPMQPNSFLPSEYFLAQALGRQARIVVGKIGNVVLPDQTAFGDAFKYHFANFNLNKNPITTSFFNPTALGLLGVWSFSPKFTIAGGVLDPYTKADRFAEPNSFKKVNIYLTSIMSYDIGGLPGQFSPVYNWSNKPKLDLDAPFGPLASAAATTQAIGSLLGLASNEGLPANLKGDSWFALATVSQYLFLKDDAATVAHKQKTGEQIRGVGMFARAGYAPDDTNPITRDASIALFAHGMLDGRHDDSFGIGFYFNKISDRLKTSITAISRGQAAARDESGMEVFYNFAITPAVRLIPSYQHIWHPLAADVAERRKSTDILQARLTVAW
ncbi:carbohydrate porin [Bradyrhizobium sp. SRS-191]|uniref:carbohydrate porin n=1 Tax=Bradyrhizobium sp. SRS-191 TaxID=2962606 RepID=UPI00211F0A6A|nr:carbohydrate porin [Bradyrhizobium sp. SRS-191]